MQCADVVVAESKDAHSAASAKKRGRDDLSASGFGPIQQVYGMATAGVASPRTPQLLTIEHCHVATILYQVDVENSCDKGANAVGTIEM